MHWTRFQLIDQILVLFIFRRMAPGFSWGDNERLVSYDKRRNNTVREMST